MKNDDDADGDGEMGGVEAVDESHHNTFCVRSLRAALNTESDSIQISAVRTSDLGHTSQCTRRPVLLPVYWSIYTRQQSLAITLSYSSRSLITRAHRRKGSRERGRGREHRSTSRPISPAPHGVLDISPLTS